MATMDEILDDVNSSVPRDDKGRFTRSEPPSETPAPVAESQAAPTPPAEPVAVPPAMERQPDLVPSAALLDERRKRQQYEAKVREYEAMEAQRQQEALRKPVTDEDFYSSPTEFVRQQTEATRQALEREFTDRWFNAMESIARSRHPDYDQMREYFIERAQTDPAIAAGIRNAADPADYAYQTAKKLKALEEVGDLDTYRSRIEKEIRAQVEAELRKPPAPPQSLNAEASPATSGNEWAGPTPIGQILKR